MINENEFLVKQIKEARKQNRLLKIAISKLQNDFERVARETKHPIEISYSLVEDDKDNIIQKLEKVMEDHNGDQLNNEQVLEKLQNTNEKLKNISQSKIDAYQDYSREEGLRKKISDEKLKNQKKSFSNKKYIFLSTIYIELNLFLVVHPKILQN